jgi:hypothetical protein
MLLVLASPLTVASFTFQMTGGNIGGLRRMMDGLAFLPVPDLTNGIHLLRTLCPYDPPETAELLD